MFKKLFRKKTQSAGTSKPNLSNLERWIRSGQPLQWAEAHNYQWNHADWEALLSDLRCSEHWPLEPNEVGAVLERLKEEHARQAAVLV